MPAGVRASASADPRRADATATASTLNYALGRRHIKSWMTGPLNDTRPGPSHLPPHPAPHPARQRGRPGKHAPPDVVDYQHVTEAAAPTTAPSAATSPSSNSTSPQLANIVTAHHQPASHARAHVIVLPSPTLSEEDMRGEEVHSNERETRRPANVDGFDLPPLRSLNASSPLRAIATGNHVRQDPPLPKRPAEEDPAPVEKRARIDSATQWQPSATASTPNTVLPSVLPPFPDLPHRHSTPRAQHANPSLSHAPSHAPSRSPSLGQLPNVQTASPRLVQTAQLLARSPNLRSNPSPLQLHPIQGPPIRQTHASPPLSARPFGMLPNVQQAAHPRRIPPLRTRSSYYDDWYSFGNCMQMLETFKTNTAASTTARSRTDKTRLQVLEEAVRGQDWAYLTLHQYYCLMTCSLQSLPPDLQSNRNLNAAYLLMQETLDDNSQLSPPFLHFFCNFPFPVDYLASNWPTRYQHAERDFTVFVNYSPNVGPLRQACERRRIPPTPREFANCAITSVTFQRLLFRSIIRILWGGYPDGPEKSHFENQALQAFCRAQVFFDQQRSMRLSGSRQHVDEELQAWVFDFTQITHSFEALRQRQAFQPINSPATQTHRQQQRLQPQAHSSTYNTPVTEDMTVARRRQQPQPQTTHHRTASQTQPLPRLRQGSTALLPRQGLIQPQQRVPTPSRFALHQAHLRSPVLHASNLSSPLHYYWQGFLLKPQRVANPNNAVEKLSFTLSGKEVESVAKALPTAPGAADGRAIDRNQKTIRLRCVKWPSNEEPNDSVWAVSENSWIPHSYFTFNKTPLQLRRKLHNSKDLPVDLTGLVREGPNVLEVSIMSNASDTTHRSYLVAIEFLGVMTQASIKELCHNNIIPAEKTINDIKRKLSPSSADDDDDDIVLVESTLTINLRDPFSASKICDTPVRGTACLHNECFDLDTFLETRPRKGDVSTADQWRCPICRADARPNTLVVDEFLVDVRRDLEKKGLLETRAIIVDQNGSWEPKPEERDPNGVQDRDTPEPVPTAMPTAARSNPPVAYEIIDLDSD